MTNILVTTSLTLEPLLQRAMPDVSMRSYASIAEVPAEEIQKAGAIVFDESTANFMELFAHKDIVDPCGKLVILTEKRAAMVRCFPQATVFSYPIVPVDIATAVRYLETIIA